MHTQNDSFRPLCAEIQWTRAGLFKRTRLQYISTSLDSQRSKSSMNQSESSATDLQRSPMLLLLCIWICSSGSKVVKQGTEWSRGLRASHTQKTGRMHVNQDTWEGRETGKREKKALEQRNRVQIWFKALIQNSMGALNLGKPSRVWKEDNNICWKNGLWIKDDINWQRIFFIFMFH